jgi:hypothetical protein
MSLRHIVLILWFAILFLIGLLIIIRSKTFINWLFDFSTRMFKGSRDVPYTEGERQANLWILIVVGFLAMFGSVLILYYLFSDLHW